MRFLVDIYIHIHYCSKITRTSLGTCWRSRFCTILSHVIPLHRRGVVVSRDPLANCALSKNARCVRIQQRESLHSTLIHDEFGDKVDSGKVESHLSTIADASAEPETANNDDLGTRGLSYRARSKFHREAVAQLNHAVAVMMIDYNNARKAILYGLDEHCRPLEESSRSSSPPAAEVAQAILENNCDVDEVEGGESDGEGSRHRQEHEVLDVGGAGLSACDLGMGSVVLAAGLMLSHSDCGRVSLEMR